MCNFCDHLKYYKHIVFMLLFHRTLFSDDIVSMTDNTTQQLKQVFERYHTKLTLQSYMCCVVSTTYCSKFPIEVLSSDDTMVLLSSCATRMDHMQVT